MASGKDSVVTFGEVASNDTSRFAGSDFVAQVEPATPAPDAKIIGPSGEQYEGRQFDEIGKGFDTAQELVRSVVLSGDLFEQLNSDADDTLPLRVEYSFIENQHTYSETVTRLAAAKGRYKLFKAGGDYSRITETNTNSYSLHVCAFVRRVDPAVRFDSRTTKMNPSAQSFLEKNTDPGQRVIQFGDRVVTGVVTGNELFIDFSVETASRTEKDSLRASLKASYGELVSGSGSFSKLVTDTKSSKNVRLSALGYGGSLDRAPLDPGAIQDQINKVLQDQSRNGIILSFLTQRMREVLIDGIPLDFVEPRQVAERIAAAISFDENVEYLTQADIDARYAINNKSEFDDQTLERASKDIETILVAKENISSMYSDLLVHFEENGKNSELTRHLIQYAEPKFDVYLQKEPAPPAPPPRKKRKRKWYEL